MYAERVMNYLTSKGLKRHVTGTACKPIELVARAGAYYRPTVREVIYRSIDSSTFIQVKNEPDATSVWKKIVSIHADKGSMYETNLLTQLQTS
ncbi:hypothetical protein BYT27DRAFT_7223945 [Phlegmacium glaucopus]|nr:hypothetical protein BYT27DRAFT_7223945 [Phlegmacium glaucopus]